MQKKNGRLKTAKRRAATKPETKRRTVHYGKAKGATAFVIREEPNTNGARTLARTAEKPFAGNIRAGKNTYVYDAHTYHTKVPPEGIAKLLEYYTQPGQVILDPFCGSGMTWTFAPPPPATSGTSTTNRWTTCSPTRPSVEASIIQR